MTFQNRNEDQLSAMVKKLCKAYLSDDWLDEVAIRLKHSRRLVPDSEAGVPSHNDSSSPDRPDRFLYGNSHSKYQATVEDEVDETYAQETNATSPRSHDSRDNATSARLETTLDPSSFSTHAIHSSSESDIYSSANVPSQTLRHGVRFSDRGPPLVRATTSRCTKPGLGEERSENALSTRIHEDHQRQLVRQWGQLFDEYCQPTDRMRQVTRIIAKQLIAKNPPEHPFLITPKMMLAFYKVNCVDSEVLPFIHIFESSSERTTRGLQYLYQRFHCSFYLIPASIGMIPSIPALTEAGFEQWMIMLVLAFPDCEAQRWRKMMSTGSIQISSQSPDFDVKPLPPQFPVALFPSTPHKKIRHFVLGVLTQWGIIVDYPIPSDTAIIPGLSNETAIPRITGSSLAAMKFDHGMLRRPSLSGGRLEHSTRSHSTMNQKPGPIDCPEADRNSHVSAGRSKSFRETPKPGHQPSPTTEETGDSRTMIPLRDRAYSASCFDQTRAASDKKQGSRHSSHRESNVLKSCKACTDMEDRHHRHRLCEHRPSPSTKGSLPVTSNSGRRRSSTYGQDPPQKKSSRLNSESCQRTKSRRESRA